MKPNAFRKPSPDHLCIDVALRAWSRPYQDGQSSDLLLRIHPDTEVAKVNLSTHIKQGKPEKFWR